MFSREQKWAQTGSRMVLKRKAETWREEYGRQCLRLPAMIHECGLCQTLAFLESKARDEGESSISKHPYFPALLDDLAEALGFAASATASGRQLLAERARTDAITDYQRLTRDALHCANYLKRYAEAILKVEPGQDNKPDAAGARG